MKHVYDRKGINILRKVELEEIKPNMLLYSEFVLRKNEFYPVVFDPIVSYDTIKELWKTGKLHIPI